MTNIIQIFNEFDARFLRFVQVISFFNFNSFFWLILLRLRLQCHIHGYLNWLSLSNMIDLICITNLSRSKLRRRCFLVQRTFWLPILVISFLIFMSDNVHVCLCLHHVYGASKWTQITQTRTINNIKGEGKGTGIRMHFLAVWATKKIKRTPKTNNAH